jgi:hypothetical protein
MSVHVILESCEPFVLIIPQVRHCSVSCMALQVGRKASDAVCIAALIECMTFDMGKKHCKSIKKVNVSALMSPSIDYYVQLVFSLTKWLNYTQA